MKGAILQVGGHWSWFFYCTDINIAIDKEKQIKKWSRAKKRSFD